MLELDLHDATNNNNSATTTTTTTTTANNNNNNNINYSSNSTGPEALCSSLISMPPSGLESV